MRKRNERGYITPNYPELFLRVQRAAERLEPRLASLVGMAWKSWEQRQPPSRWMREQISTSLVTPTDDSVASDAMFG